MVGEGNTYECPWCLEHVYQVDADKHDPVCIRKHVADILATVTCVEGERDEHKFHREQCEDALRVAREVLGDEDLPFLDDGVRRLKAERDTLRRERDSARGLADVVAVGAAPLAIILQDLADAAHAKGHTTSKLDTALREWDAARQIFKDEARRPGSDYTKLEETVTTLETAVLEAANEFVHRLVGMDNPYGPNEHPLSVRARAWLKRPEVRAVLENLDTGDG